jgi:hypothetical protein
VILDETFLSPSHFFFVLGTFQSQKKFLQHTYSLYIGQRWLKTHYNSVFTILRYTWMELMAHYSALAKWLRANGFKPPVWRRFFLRRWLIKFSFITINEMKAYQLPMIKHQKNIKLKSMVLNLILHFYEKLR